MKRFFFSLVVLLGGLLLLGTDGCSSDPNIEGAKLDLRNKDYDRALENLAAAIERNPDNADAYELKVQVLIEKAFEEQDIVAHQALIEEMSEAYQRTLELNPNKQDEMDRRISLAYYNEFTKGLQAFNRGQNDVSAYEEAAVFFGLAARICPDSIGAHVNQGYTLYNAGRRLEAIEPLENALEKGDTDTRTFSLLCDLYFGCERYADAVTLLEEATALYPDHPDLQAQLLNAYTLAGQQDRAIQSYRLAVQREPDNRLYRYNYGSLLLQENRFDEAIEHLSAAMELDPDYGNACYNLGAAYVNKAVDVNAEITSIDDELREEKDNLTDEEIASREARIEALIEVRRGLFEQAIAPLEKAKRLAEESGQEAGGICQALFSAYVQTGQQEKARAIAACAGFEDIL